MNATSAPAGLVTPVFAPFYASYLARVQGPWLEVLRRQAAGLAQWPQLLTEAQGAYAYAPGKWTIRQMLGHLTDAERIFSTRALCIARGEQQPLPGFDENDYVAQAESDTRTLAALLFELHTVRQSTILLAEGLSATALARVGTASDKAVSAEALLAITAGHLAHHVAVLSERYGVELPMK